MHEHEGCCEPTGDEVPVPRSQHAFFIVGTEHLFLVHMTNMWINCHLYQFILEVGIPEVVRQRYLEDRRRHPTDWYIVGNDHGDLMSLPNIQRGKRTSFTGSIWRSWPKNEGTPHWPWANDEPVIKHFEVEVKRVVYFRHFDFNFNYPNTLSYILFGKGNEAHMQHYQVRQPEFDHVVTLSEVPSWLPAEALEAGMHVNFPDMPAIPRGMDCWHGVYCKNPLTDGSHHVQFAGYGPGRPITIDRTVFFGTFPVNKGDVCGCKEGPAEPEPGPAAKHGEHAHLGA